MSAPVLYRVRCAFDDPAVAQRWADWLHAEHFADLMAVGARRCEVYRLDGEGCALEAQYLFDDRAALDAYVRDHADRLRAEGLRHFPLDFGLRYERDVIELIAAPPSEDPPR